MRVHGPAFGILGQLGLLKKKTGRDLTNPATVGLSNPQNQPGEKKPQEVPAGVSRRKQPLTA